MFFNKRVIVFCFCLVFLPFLAKAQVQITDSISFQTLVNDVFNSGQFVTISNITFNGLPADSSNAQIGLFSGGDSDGLDIDNGMVMSTGGVVQITDLDALFPFTEIMDIHDPDMEVIINANVQSCAVLEFDVEVNADLLAFTYLFGSVEYASYTCSTFNDAFGLFVSGPGIEGPFTNSAINIATIPESSTPVAINTVNSGQATGAGDGSLCAEANPNWQSDSQYFIQNIGNQASSITFNGYTTAFEASVEVENGETYHLKFALCNAQDGIFDSGIFFQANSLEGRLLTRITENEKPDLVVYPNPADKQIVLKNSCGNCSGSIVISICDIQGREVMQMVKNGSELIPVDVSELNRGIYFLSVGLSDGTISTEKVVIR